MSHDFDLSGFDLDPGRPKQTAEMLVHPDNTNLDEFLQIMNDIVARTRQGQGLAPVTITLTGQLQPISDLQQYWNGDTISLSMTVNRFTFSPCEHPTIAKTSYDHGWICTSNPSCHKRFWPTGHEPESDEKVQARPPATGSSE